jgi:hypothetical protein
VTSEDEPRAGKPHRLDDRLRVIDVKDILATVEEVHEGALS